MSSQESERQTPAPSERLIIDSYRLDLQRQIASLQSRLIKADLELLMAVAEEREACAALVEASTEKVRSEASLRAGISQPRPCPIAAAIRERAEQSCKISKGAREEKGTREPDGSSL